MISALEAKKEAEIEELKTELPIRKWPILGGRGLQSASWFMTSTFYPLHKTCFKKQKHIKVCRNVGVMHKPEPEATSA